MLIISPTGSTPVTVTLFEKCQNQINPYFTWQLVRKGSYDDIIFYQDDISTSPYYYNTFTLSVATNSVGLTAGLIPLTSGEWNYTIYEQNSPYILSTASAIGIVETGLLIVPETFLTTPVSYTSDNPSITPLVVYRG